MPKTSITLRIDDDLVEGLDKYARRRRWNRTQVAIEAFVRLLKEEEAEEIYESKNEDNK